MGVKSEFDALLEIQRNQFDRLFASVAHDLICEELPSASLRLHFVRHDYSGEPVFRQVSEALVSYITQYCFSAKRRKGLTELQRNQNFIAARRLFRDTPDSGQAGEMLVYMFIEAALSAPQVVKKMPLITSPQDERKGSDGVHMRWVEQESVLEVIFAEAKLWNTFSGALASAFNSMDTFHDSRTKAHEIDCYTCSFVELEPAFQDRVISYVSGENLSQSRQVHACLIGFDWKEYQCLADHRRKDFVAEFETRYCQWAAQSMLPLLKKHLEAFKHRHLRFEFFFLPFKDVDEFRHQFYEDL